MKKKPVLRIIALGDIHCCEDERYLKAFKSTLAFIKREAPDVVTFVGDLLNMMTKENAMLFHATIDEVLGDKKPAFVFSIGNHDFWPDKPVFAAPFQKAASFFKSHTGQSVNHHTVISGYHFISLAPDTDNLSYKNFIPWLTRQLKAATADTPEKPIFLLSHGRSADDNYPNQKLAKDFRYDCRFASRELYAALAPFSNVVHLVGHTHMSILDETAILQKDFTTVDCGCAAYLCPSVYGLDMYPFSPLGLLLEVYADKVVFSRLRIADSKVLKEPWQVDFPAKKENFRYVKDRFDGIKPPHFPSKDITYSRESTGCTISFTRAEGVDYVEGYRVQIENKTTGEAFTEYTGFAFFDGLEAPEKICTFRTENINETDRYTVTISAKYAFAEFDDGESLIIEI